MLLSFRLIAEERQNHSMVLLNTSPVRDTEIVLGKFLAALTFLAILLVLSLYMPLLIKVNGKISGAQIFVGYLGLFLLGAAGLAIGLFASAAHEASAARALVVGAADADLLGNLFQLATHARSTGARRARAGSTCGGSASRTSFMRGILNLKDVIFYVAATYFFLLLAVKTLEAKRWQ